MFNLEYADAATNTENVLKLTDFKNLETNERYTLIGLNIVTISLAIPLDPYRNKHDVTARVKDSLIIANGLSEIVEVASQPDFDLGLYTETLEEGIRNKFGLPIHVYKGRTDLITRPLNEICKVFYNSGKKYLELGGLVEEGFSNDLSIQKHLADIKKFKKKIKFYSSSSVVYEYLLVKIDHLKAQTLSKEESIMRKKFVRLIGHEVED